MAVTRLADLKIDPEWFAATMALESLNLDAFVDSGVAVVDPLLNAFLVNGGETVSPRFIGPLEDTDPNISSDDPAVSSIPEKIAGIKNTAVRQSLNKSWSSMDLVASLNDVDPIGVIVQQIAKYWVTVRQRRTLQSLRGVMEDSIANHGSDMVVDISGGAGAAALINPDAIIDARGSLGDRDSALSAMAVHSTVRDTMRKLNLIETIPFARGEILMPTYLGIPLIVDDGMTVVTETSGDPEETTTKYYTYFFGPGAIAMGYGAARVPFEVDRSPAAGNGGGQETVYSRQEWVIHPQGYMFGLQMTPTPAQLQDESNWTRAWERKRIPLACLISLG